MHDPNQNPNQNMQYDTGINVNKQTQTGAIGNSDQWLNSSQVVPQGKVQGQVQGQMQQNVSVQPVYYQPQYVQDNNNNVVGTEEMIQPNPLACYYYYNPMQFPMQQTQEVGPIQNQYYYPSMMTNAVDDNNIILGMNNNKMVRMDRPPSENMMYAQRSSSRIEMDNKSTTTTNASSILSGGVVDNGIDGITTESISRSISPSMSGKLGPSTYTYPGFQQVQTHVPIQQPVPTTSRQQPMIIAQPPIPDTKNKRFTKKQWDINQQNIGIVQSYELVNDNGSHIPRVTTTVWEDENTLCYQVKANGVSVVRRADNDMVNGTKLLNVTKMTRGRRDGILKAEKIRHVVKIGSMHLKGVWIPFDRARLMAEREKIADLLYPLFVRDIEAALRAADHNAMQLQSQSLPHHRENIGRIAVGIRHPAVANDNDKHTST